MTQKQYTLVVAVRFQVSADTVDDAVANGREKARDMAETVADFGAYETEFLLAHDEGVDEMTDREFHAQQITALARLLKDAADAHHDHEIATGRADPNWPRWYAEYLMPNGLDAWVASYALAKGMGRG